MFNKTMKVMEVFIATQTQYENPRNFYIYRNFLPVDKKFLNFVTSVQSKEEVISHFIEYYFDYDIDSKFDNLLFRYFTASCGLEEENFDKHNIILKDEYDGDYDFEIYFKNKYGNEGEMQTAYISIYDIPKKDYKNKKITDIIIKKGFTDNRINGIHN